MAVPDNGQATWCRLELSAGRVVKGRHKEEKVQGEKTDRQNTERKKGESQNKAPRLTGKVSQTREKREGKSRRDSAPAGFERDKLHAGWVKPRLEGTGPFLKGMAAGLYQ